jgi:hypothetical protein
MECLQTFWIQPEVYQNAAVHRGAAKEYFNVF